MILFLPLLVLKVVVLLLFFLPLLLTCLVISLLIHVVHGLGEFITRPLYKRRKKILDWCLDVKVSPANGFNSNHSDSIRKQIE